MSYQADLFRKNFMYFKYILLISIIFYTSLTAAEHKVPFGLIVDSNAYAVCPEIISIDSLIFEYKFDEAVQLAQSILLQNPNRQKEIFLNKRIGFTFYQNGYYDSAAVYLQKYFLAADEDQNKIEKGHALYYQGLNQIESGAFQKSKKNLLASLEIYKSIGYLESYWQLYPLVALIYHSWVYSDLQTAHYYELQCDSIMLQKPQVSDYLKYKYLLNKGSFGQLTDNFQQADSIFQQAIIIAENRLDALSKADIYLLYADLYFDKRENKLLEVYAQKALKILTPVLRPTHPMLGYCFLKLAQSNQNNYKYKEAAENLKQAEDIILGAFGKASIQYTFLLNSKSSLFLDMRNYDKAIKSGNERAHILSKLFGENSEQVMETKYNLAVIYITLREYDKGITLFQEYRKYFKNNNETKNNGYILSAQYLAYAYQMSKKYKEAYELLTSIKSDILEYYGADNLEYGNYQLVSGMVSYALGFNDEAEQHYLAAEDIFSKHFFPQNPQISAVRSFLAVLYGSKKEYEKSLAMYKKLLYYRNKFLESVYSYSSAEQKIRYLAVHPILMDGVNSLAFISQNQKIKEFAYTMLLRGKFAALEALTSENKLGLCSADDSVKAIYEQLTVIAEEITSMTYATQNIDSLDVRNQELKSLIDKKNSLEFKLSSSCSDYSNIFTLQKIRVKDVQEKLSNNTILLEYALFDPYLFDSKESAYNRFQDAHYALFVLDSQNALQMLDLGAASEIDSLIEEVRTSLQANQLDVYTLKSHFLEQQLKEKTKKLYQKLIEPVKELIEPKKDIYLATDGLLNLLPFDILPSTDSTYMIEKYQISYISSGRDILTYNKEYSRPSSITIFYNPDFNNNTTEQLLVSREDSTTSFIDVLRNNVCLQHKFQDLPFTSQEASSITSLIDTVIPKSSISLYSGEFASEDIVKGHLKNKDIVHFATHGFICTNKDIKRASNYQKLLLYSGLALSGANKLFDKQDVINDAANDGILSGFEIARLDLFGTKLVTLSACETAIGESLSGEGVFGLRRAFHQAGAESILMSLWKVPDQLCANLIPRFYDSWINKRFSKAKSLRKASLELLKESRETYNSGHPLLWSGFIIEGNTK